jgi:primosomal protein N' (replication factor Y)
LIPEIALTTQLLERLKIVFWSAKITVFHSKYNMNERVEVWQNILENKESARLIVGATFGCFIALTKSGV